MMRGVGKTVTAALIMMTGIVSSGQAQQPEGGEFPLDGIAAIVGTEIILRSEIDMQLYIDSQNRGLNLETLSEAQIDTLRRQILDNLITQKVIVARARRDSIVVSRGEVDAAVDRWMDQIRESMGGDQVFQAQLAAEGMTERDLRERRWEMTENELLRNRLFQQIGIRQSPVSRQEGEAFLHEYASDLMALRSIYLSAPPTEELTALARQRAEELRRRIVEERESFAALARSESADTGSGSVGGDLGEAPRGTYVASIDSTVWNTPLGTVSEPVRSQYGWHLVEVLSRDDTAARARHILIGFGTDQALAARIEEVENALNAGEEFGDLARRYSDAPGIEESEGFYAVLPRQTTPQESQLPAEWLTRVQALSPGEWAGPFDSPQGIFFFQRMPLDETTIELILRVDFARIEAYLQNQRQIAQIEEYLEQLRNETYIEIKP